MHSLYMAMFAPQRISMCGCGRQKEMRGAFSVSDLTTPGTIIQIGVEPVRVVITAIDGVEFDPAWNARMSAYFADQEISVLSREHLLQNKRASGRTQDLADIEAL